MSQPIFTRIGFRAGIWQGRIQGTSSGMIDVLHQGQVLEEVEVTPEAEKSWILSVSIPSECLGQGISTFIVRDRESSAEIGGFSIIVDADDDSEDMRAELRLLRAELDLLKQAFRRHMNEN